MNDDGSILARIGATVVLPGSWDRYLSAEWMR
jgi:hypothetical protein